MLLVPVVSSDIAAAGYDPDSTELQLQYTNGRIYSYQPVPPSWYDGFIAAPSKGSYVAQTLRKFPDMYPYKRIDGGINAPAQVQAVGNAATLSQGFATLQDIEKFEGLI